MCPLLVFDPDALMSVLGSGAFIGPYAYRAQIFLASEIMWRLRFKSTSAVDRGKFSFRELLRYYIVWTEWAIRIVTEPSRGV
jgi:hypothetical protein